MKVRERLSRGWRMPTRRDRTGGRRRGQSLVEMALIMPVMALLLLGAVDLGRIFYANVQLTNGVREGALFARMSPAAVRNSDRPDPDNIVFKIRDESHLDLRDEDITVRCYQGSLLSLIPILRGNGSCTLLSGLLPGDQVQVTARYRFRPLTSQVIGILPREYVISSTLRMALP